MSLLSLVIPIYPFFPFSLSLPSFTTSFSAFRGGENTALEREAHRTRLEL